MFATFPRGRSQRRGVVLILVLGMLGLLALVGVTFATFSGQVKINSRNFSQAQNWPESTELMDYALAQLIDDTDNPQSAIRGHSLKRDMYGNDGRFNSALAVNPADGLAFSITGLALIPPGTVNRVPIKDVDGTDHEVNVAGLIQVTTSIAAGSSALYGYNFTRWVMKFPSVVDPSATPAAYYVGETHEILADVEAGGFRVFYVAPDDNSPVTPAGGMPTPAVATESPAAYSQAPTIPYPLPAAAGYQPDGTLTAPPIQNYSFYNYNYMTGAQVAAPGQSTLVGLTWRLANGNATNRAATFTLDGRFLHAFNGPGVAAMNSNLSNLTLPAAQAAAIANRGMGQFANFRTNGNILSGTFNGTNNFMTPWAYGMPDQIAGMDEDYDACDLENWFLAMQSGDSQVIIPSFHRPGILAYDTTVPDPTNTTGTAPYDDWESQNVFSASKILRPRKADGHDPVTFKNLYPDASGKIVYDVDNDGDGITDSVWLDLGYPARRNTDGRLFKPLFSFMVIGLNGRIPLNTAGNLQLRSLLDPATGNFGKPLRAHASGKGYSPSEIDPTYALQNAFIEGPAGVGMYSPLDNAGATAAGTLVGGVYTPGDGTDPGTYPFSPWWGSAGVPVALTQLRNILAGTRLPDSVQNAAGVPVPTSDDRNFVMVNGAGVYLPNGVLDAGDGNNPAVTTTTPVGGRWGEAGDQPVGLTAAPFQFTSMTSFPPAPPSYNYENQVGPGMSGHWMGGAPRYGDARDDNYNSFDWFPPNPNPAAPLDAATGSYVITTLGENADLFDASGSVVLPVERLRRFVSPIDVMGDGFLNNLKNPFSRTPGTPTPLLGGDDFGRVSFVKHFRPPGLPLATPPGLPLPVAPLPANTALPPTDFLWYPYSKTDSFWLSGIGKPAPPTRNTPQGTATALVPVDLTNNLYRGYESYRMPRLLDDNPSLSTMVGGMPFNNVPAYVAGTPEWRPTYDQAVNTKLNLANLNEADEMQLYSPQASDQPFGPSDLEWLYRQQDTDGASLSSRLEHLAPISFTNPRDGARRRRLFSVETWEPTTFVWAHDNPADDPQWPVVNALATSAPYGNSRLFASPPTGGAANFIAAQNANLSTLSYLLSTNANVYEPNATSLAYTNPLRLPSLAHRDRKINLNYPLPVSNRYDEPVRQKWIRETYQLLKQILPPKAVDTPEELVQLSQFVVNIIDYRDPDATSTRFVNTDVYYTAAATATEPAKLAFTSSFTGDIHTLLGPPWFGTTLDVPPPYSPIYDNVNSPYVVQQGMEYNPIAITEVLAYQFRYKDGMAPSLLTPRIVIELLNTLTDPTDYAATGTPASDASRASDLTLDGWDFIILPDDPTGRPDPFTGQLPLTALPNTTAAVVKGVTTSNKELSMIGTADPGGLTQRIQAIDKDHKAHPYVIQSQALPANTEVNGPDADATIDLINNTVMGGLTPAEPKKFYWLYLRRPANPFDTSYDPKRPNENRVVVDAFRFIYNKAKGEGTTAGGTDTVTGSPAAGDLFSTRRLQPFRGGHSVAPKPGVSGADNYCIPAYGYTEQTIKGLVDDRGEENDSASNLYTGRYGTQDVTGAIFSSFGRVAQDGGSDNTPYDYAWDYLPFNDRDFTSVSELLLVPGCPPGLFTKQFVELSPGITGSIPLVEPPAAGDLTGMPPLTTVFTKATETPTAGSTTTPATTSRPHTYPYLMDEFFYTAQSEPSAFLATVNDAPAAGQWPDPAAGPAPIHQPSNFEPTFPIRNVTTTDPLLPSVPNYIGGPSQAGWFRMFEFFDVPSPANGSTGPVAQGTNYDWARQDLKPGLLNINLIMDEEVFFAVMSESWLKTLGFNRSLVAPFSPAQEDLDNMGSTRLNVQQIQDGQTPQVVTQVNFNGTPRSSYRMPNQGFMALDPVRSEVVGQTAPFFGNKMKAAFSDFLKLRHGGSGFMFAHQSGNVGDPDTSVGTTMVASERPYHSFSYPDVNYTLMRPAALPPTTSTPYIPYLPSWTDYVNRVPQVGPSPAPFPTYVGDPGVKNPYLFTNNNPVQPPPIPPRRLFQVPDVWGNVTAAIGMPAAAGSPAAVPSNASRWTTPYDASAFTGDPNVNWLNLTTNRANPLPIPLSRAVGDLSAIPTPIVLQENAVTAPNYVVVPNFYLGANTRGSDNDNRQHPAYRTEWLQKVTNLTTVRTHQYAVWITVGFFEVTKQGDPTVGNLNPGLAYDRLGAELNVQSGKNVRYRSFFVIDRTRAVGFSPQAPGNFRDCIVYRQAIE